MLLINLIFEFCVVIVQAGCTPRAWLPSDLATSPLVCNLYVLITDGLLKLYLLDVCQAQDTVLQVLQAVFQLLLIGVIH